MLRLPGRSWVVDGAQDERRYDGVHGRVGQRQALDPESALREVARLLRPNERLLLIEHVRAKSWFLAACQDKLLQSWRVFAGGCVCNRPTLELMCASGFAVEATMSGGTGCRRSSIRSQWGARLGYLWAACPGESSAL